MTKPILSRRDLFRCASGVTAGMLAIGNRGQLIPEADAAALVTLPAIRGVVSSGSGLNVRSGPAYWQSLIKWLPNGTPLSITATSGDWFKVSALGATGWVNSWYVLLTGTKSKLINRGAIGVKRVALTFDCGSDYGYTDNILTTLTNHGITASFGMTGSWLKSYPDGAKKITGAGYQVINHTLDHPSFTGVSTPGVGNRSPAKRLSQFRPTKR